MPNTNILPPGCNGCGGAGQITKFWLRLTKRLPSWELCCDQHDLAYTQGGSETDRAWADALLRDCMIKLGHEIQAWIYWGAVRLFGASYWGKD